MTSSKRNCIFVIYNLTLADDNDSFGIYLHDYTCELMGLGMINAAHVFRVRPKLRLGASRHPKVHCIPAAMFKVGGFVTGHEFDDAGP